MMSNDLTEILSDDLGQAETLTEEEHLGLLDSLAPEYRDMSDDELYELVSVTLAEMTPEQAEGFWKAIGKVGKFAKKALPGAMAGATAGAALGPYGAIAGGLLGGLSTGLSKPKKPGKTVQPRGKAPASAQLLQLIQSPQLQQALMSLIMGKVGKKTIPVGKERKQVPVAGFMNLLGSLATLASKAAVETHATSPEEAYLRGPGGEFMFDPAVPEQRAEALFELLQQDEAFLNSGESIEEDPVEWLLEAAETGEEYPATVILEWE